MQHSEGTAHCLEQRVYILYLLDSNVSLSSLPARPQRNSQLQKSPIARRKKKEKKKKKVVSHDIHNRSAKNRARSGEFIAASFTRDGRSGARKKASAKLEGATRPGPEEEKEERGRGNRDRGSASYPGPYSVAASLSSKK